MKSFLAVIAVLQPAVLLSSASHNAFSVNDDLLAFPQYEVHFRNDYISWDDAEQKIHDQSRGKQKSRKGSGNDSSKVNDDDNNNVEPEGESRDDTLSYEMMVLDGHDFLCSIPKVNVTDSQRELRNETLIKVEKEKELARAVDRGWELLAGMEDRCIYYIEGWWSYRFCYGKGVKQFHQLPPTRGAPAYPPVEDKSVQGYELGVYRNSNVETDEVQETSIETTRAEGNVHRQKAGARGEIVERGETRYLVQRLGGGTTCDLTLKDRTIEVQFHCNPQSADRIMLIKEKATCSYLMVIHTPRLCNDVAFLPPQKDQPNAIQCRPILEDKEVEIYEQDLKELREAETKEKIDRASSDIAAALGLTDRPKKRQFVGDIEVGAHALLSEDVKLEPGAIVGGGKTTFVETIATSEGKIISPEDVKRLKLGEMDGIKELQRQVKKHAAGKKWKLDLVETPQGRREFRAIIGDDTDGEETEMPSATPSPEKKGGKSPSDSDAEDGDEAGSEEELYKPEL